MIRNLLIIFVLLVTQNLYGQDSIMYLDSRIFAEKQIFKINYFSTSDRSEVQGKTQLDTTDNYSFTIEVNPTSKKTYKIKLYDFLELSNHSTVDTLNSLYNYFFKSQEYNFEAGELFKNPKITNLDEVKKNNKFYSDQINEIYNNIWKYTSDGYVKYGVFKIPQTVIEIENFYNLKVTNTIGVYFMTTFSKDYIYPFKLNNLSNGKPLIDTVHIQKTSIDDNKLLVNFFLDYDYSKVEKSENIQDKKNDKESESIKTTMSTSTKYIINKLNHKLEQIQINSKVTLGESKYGTNTIIKIIYGG